MKFETFNIFPTTIYVGQSDNHDEHKNKFYNVYSKFDYEETDIDNTVSENINKPLIHLDESLNDLFGHVVSHVKTYVCDVLQYRDIFDYAITKSWLSRSRKPCDEIRQHIHSTSHISFAYYLNIPDNSHAIEFHNDCSKNILFEAMNVEDDNRERTVVNNYNYLNAQTFFIHPPEGSIILFPSRLIHNTKFTGGLFEGERLAIVGDVTTILKEDQFGYSVGYISEKYWKKY